MSVLQPESFAEFFNVLWGYAPFPWQVDFAHRLSEGRSPDYVTVPTGSGKTACLDAAIFALAVQASRPPSERTAGRRIFFIVNRRIIVDEAFERAKVLVEKLTTALTNSDRQNTILHQVASALSTLAGGTAEPPLACAELRGGIYKDRAWARSLLQPMILCTTVDQAGSRLLFRGYGVSDEARPIHAALVAQDSLLLIDEAHISQPFLQTLGWVKRYRLHQSAGTETVILPFSVVCMTATPPNDENTSLLDLSQKDWEHPILSNRLKAHKPVRLVPAGKGKLIQVLEAEASNIIAKTPSLRSIAIMVNRVASARELETLLSKRHRNAEVRLLIGRMRPLDRDKVTGVLQSGLKTGIKPGDNAVLQIVVSTQCLEVGADLDFDALVTECASLDALRQRFGRLNRGGRSDITAQGVIVMPEEQRIEEAKLKDDKPSDPIYGNAIPRTWRWLERQAKDGIVDFALNAMTDAVSKARQTDEQGFDNLLMPRSSAPVLLPAYLDCWVQTNPSPAADPDVSLFLHGPQRDMAEVQVCWRADLPDDINLWADTVALCPPTSLECLPVPLHLMRRWLQDSTIKDTSGDVPASLDAQEAAKGTRSNASVVEIKSLCWLDERSLAVTSPADLRPGQTIILPAQDGSWNTLGHVPGATVETIDRAEEGQAMLRRRAVVRLHEKAWWPKGETDTATQLREWAKLPDFDWQSKEARTALSVVAEESAQDPSLANRVAFIATARKPLAEPYPDGSGVVLSAYGYVPYDLHGGTAATDDGPDDPLLESTKRQRLDVHTSQVSELAKSYAAVLGLSGFHEAVATAARFHDLGKADPRFQALLLQSTPSTAQAQPVLWAKSDSIPVSTKAREQVREKAGLPKGFRHEMLSVQLASLQAASAYLPKEERRFVLTLHLIASHHGHARPFAPIVTDHDPSSVTLHEYKLDMSREERLASPAHAIDSGIAERFWELTRMHGWWGLSFLEAVLRLADQTASANPTS